MKLNSSDILRLYGKKLFVLEGWEKSDTVDKDILEQAPKQETEVSEKVEIAETPVEVPEKKAEPQEVEVVVETKPESPKIDLSRFTTGSPVVWKMKPSAKFALILHKSEFTNRALTSLLKQSILKAGIDPALVGFGVIENESTHVKLENMSVDFALICDKMGDAPSPLTLSSKKVWLIPRLSELPENEAKQKELDDAMAGLAAAIQ